MRLSVILLLLLISCSAPNVRLTKALDREHIECVQVQADVSRWVASKSSECLDKALIVKKTDGKEKSLASYNECIKGPFEIAKKVADEIDTINASIKDLGRELLLTFKEDASKEELEKISKRIEEDMNKLKDVKGRIQ